MSRKQGMNFKIMIRRKNSKNRDNFIMPGDFCVVGLTVGNNVIIYDKYTNNIRTVQMKVFEDLKKRNKFVNSQIDFQKLSVYDEKVNHVVTDKGIYIIGKIQSDKSIQAYRIFGSGCKPLDIPADILIESSINYINAEIVDGELKVEQY